MTLAPNGNLLVVCNDSGWLFRVNNTNPPALPSDIRLTALGEDGVRLSWTGIFGRGYRLESSPDLVPANWLPIGAAGGKAGNAVTEFINPEPSTHPKYFYRILPSL